MAKRKWTRKDPKRRLSIDFVNEAQMVKFYTEVVKPYFDANGDDVSLFERDALDARDITPTGEFIVKRAGDRPYGEMKIEENVTLVPKAAP